MRAFIEYPDISDERIEVKRELVVQTRDRFIQTIIEGMSRDDADQKGLTHEQYDAKYN